MQQQPTFLFGAVLLAAGKSSRMGTPKMLLPWGRTSVLGHLLGQWQTLGAAKVAVVSAARDSAVAAELSRLSFPPENRIENPQPERGMFSSIQCAARWHGWRPELACFAIALGDQPHIRLDTLRQVVAFAREHPATSCQPAYLGRAKHPVLLVAPEFRELARSTAGTLAEFLRAHPPACCEIADPGLDLDMDTPEDYQELLSLFPPAGESP